MFIAVRLRQFLLCGSAAFVAATCQAAAPAAGATVNFQLDGWADNWFAAYLGDKLIVEDSEPVMQEMSFNAESARFTGQYPLQLNFILKDYKENNTGLEYIGSRRQQMGDGGFVMQVTDLSTGKVVAVSDENCACKVIQTAPLERACMRQTNPVAGVAPCAFTELPEPAGWKSAAFDDSGWKDTTIWSAREVSPKDGYYRIRWDSRAKFIWGPDINTSNTILCRLTVNKPAS